VQSRTFTELPPLSLYVHLPWCVKKCPYCDFNSHEQKNELPEDDYVNALLADLSAEMPRIWGRTITSIFIGGGTPSLFSAVAMETLISGIRALTAFSPSIEVTMEANPGTFEQEKFTGFRQAGINRLSIGVQSFNDKALNALGRIHNGDDAANAVSMARTAGFDNVNVDLMFGLPDQTEADSLDDVQQALALAPDHISFYELTMEPNTLFAKRPPTRPDADTQWAMQNNGIALLAEHGFHRYEISAFSTNGRRSTHNVNYWLFGDYVGIGAGAHSKVSFANSGDIIRRWKIKHPQRYLDAAKSDPDKIIGGDTTISFEDTAIEFFMNALRLVDGFPIPLFQQHTGVSIDHWQGAIEAASQRGLLRQSGFELKATREGFDFLNDLLDCFMPEQSDTSDTDSFRYPVIPLTRD